MNKKTRELFPRPLIPDEQWEDDFNEKDDFMEYLHILKMQDLLKS